MSNARAKGPRRSPAMEQFFREKERYPDAILFFRMGDFYEMFFEDAVIAASVLDITLTSRGTDTDGGKIPLAGVPHHAASGYIARLLAAGHRVAVAEQMEDPSKVKGVVPREVVRVVTPGLVVDPDALDARESNYLVCVDETGGSIGVAVLEISTGELRACSLKDRAALLAELVRLEPRELLVGRGLTGVEAELSGVLSVGLRRDAVDVAAARADERFAPLAHDLQGAHGMGESGLCAAAMAVRYAHDALIGAELGVQRIAPYDPEQQLWLDDAAVRTLEIIRTMTGERRGSLVHLLDETVTAMGARLLRRRLVAPLTDVAAIRRRHDEVEALVGDIRLRTRLREMLNGIADLERLATRVTLSVATPRDLGSIRDSVRRAVSVSTLLSERQVDAKSDSLSPLSAEELCVDLYELLERSLVAEPPLAATSAGIFAQGYDARVDELRALSTSAKDVLLELERRERDRTGINSLKVRYTRVFGYYIEITKANLRAVPADYRRKQTVAGAERFVTEELDALQVKILNADTKLEALEAELFAGFRASLAPWCRALRGLATRLAQIDVSAALADVAHRYDYVRPNVDDSCVVDIREGRHPIVERLVARGAFVPNDVRLQVDGERMMVITGPNMAGKSTVMRQVALAVLMAQAGGFVPASQATLGVVDRIYTRVGASDNLSQGQSTFMLEMHEVANILRGATRRSLVIVDEVGRGTSTYDGLAIAWAVAEHLHDVIGCRAMFATHYHELCDLVVTRQGVANYNVAAKEHRDTVVFLRKLVPGGANKSYGVAVARLAGLPEAVLGRARELLRELEANRGLPVVHGANGETARGSTRTGVLEESSSDDAALVARRREVLAALEAIDPDQITPLQALEFVARLRAALGEGA